MEPGTDSRRRARRVALAALLLALLAGAWWWLQSGRGGGPSRVEPAATQGEITAPGATGTGLGAGLAARGLPVAAEDAPPAAPATDSMPEAGSGRTLVVRVFDQRGTAVRKATVRAWAPARLTKLRLTGEDGAASLSLRGGETTVEVLAPEPAVEAERWLLGRDDVPIPPDAALVDVVLEDARAVAGVVRDTRGALVPQTTIAAVGPGEESATARTDANGRFRFLLASDGPWDIVVVSRPLLDNRRPLEYLSGAARGVTPGTLDLDITATPVKADRSLTVVVSLDDGRPGSSSYVSLLGGPEGWTDKTGQIVFAEIAPGPWEILVLPRGADAGVGVCLFETVHHVIAEGQTVELRARRGAVVEGVVRDAAGNPLGDVEVSVVPEGRHEACCRATTGADGAFSLIVQPELPCPATLVAKVYPVLKLHPIRCESVVIPAVPVLGVDVRMSGVDSVREPAEAGPTR